jgi:NAD(P)-dependent dehydrogenase (short-subunit alcohol dehydrogenase family)
MMQSQPWRFDDVPDQAGRVALITGANNGLGFETARMLAARNAEVILACRSWSRGEQALRRLRAACPLAKVSLLALDLADLASVEEAAATVMAERARLDLLINNAGVMVPPFARTKQGFELQFGTNYLGHFALTGRLLPLILRTPGSRVVVLSSKGADFGQIVLDDLNYERRRFSNWGAYCQSKLADLLFALELARRLADTGHDTIATAAHPGGAATALQRNASFFRFVVNPFLAATPAAGALPTLRATTDPDAGNGSYWGPSGLFEMRGAPSPAKVPGGRGTWTWPAAFGPPARS